MIPDNIAIITYTAKGSWAPEGDDRWFVDRATGLLYVANGSGPTYGGYHAPFGLDPGLDALREAFSRPLDAGAACPSGADRLRGAVLAAHAVMQKLDAAYQEILADELARAPQDFLGAARRAADRVRPLRWREVSSFCHFAGSVTACSLEDGVPGEGGVLAVAQVGDGRAYHLRGGVRRTLVPDHTLRTRLAEAGGADSTDPERFRHVVTRLLGMGEMSEPDQAEASLAPGDTLLLCSSGVWNHAAGDGLVDRLLTAPVDAFGRFLEEARPFGGRDATAIRVSL
mgnify:CR=1 FL=1